MTEWPSEQARPHEPGQPAEADQPSTAQPAAAPPAAFPPPAPDATPASGYAPPTSPSRPDAAPSYAPPSYAPPVSSASAASAASAPSYTQPLPTGYQPPTYPPSGYPQSGYQQSGYPQTGYPQTGYPQTGYPQSGYQQSSYPQSGYAQSGYQPTYQQPAYSGPGYGQPGAPAAPAQRPPRPRSVVRIALLAALIAAVVGGGIGAAVVAALDHTTKATATISYSNATPPTTAKTDGTVTAAAAKIQPSVVTINVAGSSESGTGSGIILNTDGYILTNNHVVAVAGTSGQVQVITNDGQSAFAKVIGVDQSDDLAVVKVTGLTNLVKADFASSSALQVGQTVVAVGAPLGLSNTVTSGIVSNTARPVETGDSSSAITATFDAIQTDAAINPGNSGGPLVNLNGDVVGINAAIATADSGGLQVPGQTQQSGSIGIGFAIPSDEASRIAGELITNGTATHAVIGVNVQDSSAQNTSIQTTVGATISEVSADGAAAKAGLKVGDVVTKAGNQLIVNGTDLVAAIRSFKPGQTIDLTYQRSGSAHTVKVTLGTATS